MTINGLRDYAGIYAASTVATSVTPVQETVAPTFTVTPISPMQLATVNVHVKNLNDYLGNMVVEKSSSVVLFKPTVPPTVTASRVLPGTTNQVEVTFNEAVSGIVTGDFYVTDRKAIPTGCLWSLRKIPATRFVLTLGSSPAATATYSVALKEGTVTDATVTRTQLRRRSSALQLLRIDIINERTR